MGCLASAVNGILKLKNKRPVSPEAGFLFLLDCLMAQESLAPNTTAQQDLTTAGQRAISLVWENTQARIALFVVIIGILTNALVIIVVIFLDKEITVNQLALISICLQFINLTTGIVIGFYFSRTNHQAIGGIGPKPSSPYEGR